MKALEFEGQVESYGQIRIPPDVTNQIPEGIGSACDSFA